jgi:uncharacterized protein (DUF302 family)
MDLHRPSGRLKLGRDGAAAMPRARDTPATLGETLGQSFQLYVYTSIIDSSPDPQLERAMTIHSFRAERIDLISYRSFSDAVEAFHNRVPGASVAVLTSLASANAAEIEHAVQEMVGDLGLMILAKVEQGPIVSRLGRLKNMITFLIGNPVLANRMFEKEPAICAYAPLRASIYEDQEGRTHFEYENPSASLSQFEGDEIRSVAKTLDEKMAKLAEHIVQPDEQRGGR